MDTYIQTTFPFLRPNEPSTAVSWVACQASREILLLLSCSSGRAKNLLIILPRNAFRSTLQHRHGTTERKGIECETVNGNSTRSTSHVPSDSKRRTHYRLIFPLEKNLAMPRAGFSGVRNDDGEEDDFDGLCFGRFELKGDLVIGLASVSEEINGILYASASDLRPVLGIMEEASPVPAGSHSGESCIPWSSRTSISSSTNAPVSAHLSITGLPTFTGGDCNTWSCFPRRKMVSWHSANFSAAAAISLSCKQSKNTSPWDKQPDRNQLLKRLYLHMRWMTREKIIWWD